MSHPIVGVGAVIWQSERVLLIRRAQPPRQGTWSLPGGKQQWGETVFQAVEREVAEETGVAIRILDIAAVVDLIDRGEDGAIRYHYTVIDVAAEWLSGEAVAGDDAEAVAWAAPDDYDRYDLTPLVRDVIARSGEKRRGAKVQADL